MSEQSTADIALALNRIADEISEHLLWMRQQKAAEDARRTHLPPVQYKPDINLRMLNGQWPRRDGNVYGMHPETDPNKMETFQKSKPEA